MLSLTHSAQAWDTPDFNKTLKAEICNLDASLLPLQQALAQSSYTEGNNRNVVILKMEDDSNYIFAKIGVFYTGIIPGCACSDDPTPDNEYNEYCELQLKIDKSTGNSEVELLP